MNDPGETVVAARSDAPDRVPRVPVSVIESKAGWQPIDLRELWRYRELLYLLIWRDVKVRYKQTELGIAWVVIQPLLTTGIFVVLFSLLLAERGNELAVPGVPYALSTFCAMLPWQLFADSLLRSGNSLLAGQNLITKIYFPRLILPLSAVMAALVDFAIASTALVIMLLCYRVVPSWAIVTLPLFVALAVMASLAVGLWLSALGAMYRDFIYVQPFLIRIGMYASPVIYATANLRGKLPDWALTIYGLNPMVGVIEGFRWALFGTPHPPGLVLVPSVLMTAVLLLGGAFFFRRVEKSVVDII